MRLSLILRLSLASAAFMLSLPSGATSYQTSFKVLAKRTPAAIAAAPRVATAPAGR